VAAVEAVVVLMPEQGVVALEILLEAQEVLELQILAVAAVEQSQTAGVHLAATAVPVSLLSKSHLRTMPHSHLV